jgi:hypothetical protein
MPQLIDVTDHDEFEATARESSCRSELRARLILLLPDIASAVTEALSAADLRISIFLSVPRSGSFLTIATPTDPSDAIRERICEIVCDIVEDKTGIAKLVAREFPCISGGMPTIAVSELCVDDVGPTSPIS